LKPKERDLHLAEQQAKYKDYVPPPYVPGLKSPKIVGERKAAAAAFPRRAPRRQT